MTISTIRKRPEYGKMYPVKPYGMAKRSKLWRGFLDTPDRKELTAEQSKFLDDFSNGLKKALEESK